MYTQSTAQNHIQQEWVQTKKSDPTEQIVIIAAAIALSIVTGGTAGVALAGALGATGVAVPQWWQRSGQWPVAPSLNSLRPAA